MTTFSQKFNLTDQNAILILNPPESLLNDTKELEKQFKVYTEINAIEQFDFVLAFVKAQKEINDLTPQIAPKLAGDGVFWFCYPKETSKKYDCDINPDKGWSILAKYDFEAVRQVSIDEDWKALRFRRKQYIKAMSKNFAGNERRK